MPTTLQRLKYARQLLEAHNGLKAGDIDDRQATILKSRIAALRQLLLGEGGEPVKAKPNATLHIAEAVEKAIAETNGEVTTGDGLHWALSKKALNKMVAATNQDGPKAYQRERIIAIQSLADLAKAATNPVIRDDDGRDVEMDKVYEYFVPFEVGGDVLTVRLLCKHFKETSSRSDKIHSIAMDAIGGPRHQDGPDGLLIGLELLPWDVTERGEPDLSVSPSADNTNSIAKPIIDSDAIKAIDDHIRILVSEKLRTASRWSHQKHLDKEISTLERQRKFLLDSPALDSIPNHRNPRMNIETPKDLSLADNYVTITPFGKVDALFWPEDHPLGNGVDLRGPADAVAHIVDVMQRQTNGEGYSISPGTCTPLDYFYFCQPEGYGIRIFEPFDAMVDRIKWELAEDRQAALDDASGGQMVQDSIAALRL